MKETQEIELQSHILAADEHSSFKNLAKHHSHPLTIVFSAKESIYKALYPLVKAYFGS